MNRRLFKIGYSFWCNSTGTSNNQCFSKNLADNNIDILVDTNGNYIQQALL